MTLYEIRKQDEKTKMKVLQKTLNKVFYIPVSANKNTLNYINDIANRELEKTKPYAKENGWSLHKVVIEIATSVYIYVYIAVDIASYKHYTALQYVK